MDHWKEKTKDILSAILSSLPDISFGIRDVRVCVFLTAVMSRTCGLASTLISRSHRHETAIRHAGRLIEMDAFSLARYCLSDHSLEASIGLAALNSLIEVNERICREINAFELLIQRGRGKKVALIGHFPFIERLRKEAGKLWVLEKEPREGDLPSEKAQEVLPEADVVAITASSLINHTLFEILSLCSPDCFRILLGPSSPMSTVLFDYGIDAVAGVKVVDPEAVIRTISEGAHFRAVEGTKRLSMIKP